MDTVGAADMLAINEDVGDSALPGHVKEFSLDLGTLLVLIKLEGSIGDTELVEEALGLLAIRAVALGEDLHR